MWTLIPSTQYEERLVHSYQKSSKSHPVIANNWSLSIANWLKLLHLQAPPRFSMNRTAVNEINEIRLACWYGRTLGSALIVRKYPSASVDQQRIAGLRPDPFRALNVT